jgi:hypothetical protein
VTGVRFEVQDSGSGFGAITRSGSNDNIVMNVPIDMPASGLAGYRGAVVFFASSVDRTKPLDVVLTFSDVAGNATTCEVHLPAQTIANSAASLTSLTTTPPTAPTADCAGGVYYINSTFRNTSVSRNLTALYFKVVTLTNGRVITNVDAAPGTPFKFGGVGSDLIVPAEDFLRRPNGGYGDTILAPGESFNKSFGICLASRTRFTFFVDFYAAAAIQSGSPYEPVPGGSVPRHGFPGPYARTESQLSVHHRPLARHSCGTFDP